MTVLEFRGVVKDYHGLRPLRVLNLAIETGERVALSGLDVPAAEAFIHLATGAAVPDQGEVRVMGEATSAITDGDLWLASLERFGIVSHRAVLLDAATIAQNIAMSFSLAIEPIPADISAKVDALAEATEISTTDLDRNAGAVSAAVQMRAHLARALALNPPLLVLEHPTLRVERGEVAALAASIVRATSERNLSLLALTDDEILAKGLKARRLKLNASTGALNKWGRVSIIQWFRE